MFGYVFFDDIPQPRLLIGAAIIIAAGMFIVLREQMLARAGPTPPSRALRCETAQEHQTTDQPDIAVNRCGIFTSRSEAGGRRNNWTSKAASCSTGRSPMCAPPRPKAPIMSVYRPVMSQISGCRGCRSYQVPHAEAIRQRTGVVTRAVGLIYDPRRAEAILQAGKADFVALGRALLDNPRRVFHAAEAFGETPA